VTAQLRIFTVKRGAMEAWVDEWQQQVAPLRRRFGFNILGPWIIEAEDKFVWILEFDGPEGWDAADAAYYESEERRAITPEPTRHLAAAEEWPLRAV
jgi:hypothetical protein